MATFIKLTNGDIVNNQYIKSVKRHEYMSAGALARYLHEDNQEGKRVETVPSIELLLGSDSNPLLLKYESSQERDAEFERIEAILLGQPPVLFSMLALRPENIQSMHIEWTGHLETTLELQIKTADTEAFVVRVTRDDEEDWKRAQELIAQFGLDVPKTTQERLEERWAKDYDEKGNLKAGHYGGKL